MDLKRRAVSAFSTSIACLCIIGGLPAQALDKTNVGAENSSGVSSQQFYILGPGDWLHIELVNIPELSGYFKIGPDGTLYLPRLRALYVEGLTVEELHYFLRDQFKAFVKDPNIYVAPVGFRPVRVYVGGEIERPGYYILSLETNSNEIGALQMREKERNITLKNGSQTPSFQEYLTSRMSNARWPTLFDALRAASGVTQYSNLAEVQVTRRLPLSSGGKKMRTNIDFLKLITEGNEDVNIRLFDGDVVYVAKSSKVSRDNLLSASRTNLSPNYIEVFVSGRVKEPGAHTLPQGSTLNQAIASAGGPKLLRGGVEFLRFNPDGTSDMRRFSYDPKAEKDNFKNPLLMNGDIVRINDSLFSAGVEVLNEITGPAVGVYSVYSLFKP